MTAPISLWSLHLCSNPDVCIYAFFMLNYTNVPMFFALLSSKVAKSISFKVVKLSPNSTKIIIIIIYDYYKIFILILYQNAYSLFCQIITEILMRFLQKDRLFILLKKEFQENKILSIWNLYSRFQYFERDYVHTFNSSFGYKV